MYNRNDGAHVRVPTTSLVPDPSALNTIERGPRVRPVPLAKSEPPPPPAPDYAAEACGLASLASREVYLAGGRPDLPDLVKGHFVAIAAHANRYRAGDTGKTIPELAQATGLDERGLRKSVRILCDRGLLEIENHRLRVCMERIRAGRNGEAG